MDWRAEGILLTTRPHGETGAIVTLFTEGHGRHAGIVRGGQSRRLRPVLQPGAQVDATWTARLGEHLGAFAVEPLRSRAGLWQDRLTLAGLSAICAMLEATLPERAAHPGLYRATLTLLEVMDRLPDWPLVYLRWEIGLLSDLGFALDLGRCAVTGATGGLAYVSPRSGRAVARAAAGEWAGQLLPLPGTLGGDRPPGPGDLAEGLAITGHFLTRDVLHGAPLPEARMRLATLLARTDINPSPSA